MTAKLSLATPGALVLIVDLGLWQLIVRGLDKLPGDLIKKQQQIEAVQAFMLSVPRGAAWDLILFLIAAGFAVWLILPAALSEERPPDDARWLGLFSSSSRSAAPEKPSAASSTSPSTRSTGSATTR